MSKEIKAFITYAHTDSEQKIRLKKSLAVMKNNGEIATWDDNQILASDEWEKEIATYLADSDILLYLVSANSLASKNCNRELGEALKNTSTKTISIILENCDWKAHELGKLEVLPDKGKAINKWSPRADGWQNMVEGIRKTVQAIQKVEAEPPANEQEKEKIDALALFQQANFLLMLRQFVQAIQAYSEVIERNPNLPEAYWNRVSACLHLKRWGQAKSNLQTARDRGIDIIDFFNIVYESVAGFESKTGIKLPADIAEMLTRKPDKGKS